MYMYILYLCKLSITKGIVDVDQGLVEFHKYMDNNYYYY